MGRKVNVIAAIVVAAVILYFVNAVYTANIISFQTQSTGDLNGDGKVNVFDLVIAGKSVNSYPGHAKWKPAADVNRDNRIDVQDLDYIKTRFGTVSR